MKYIREYQVFEASASAPQALTAVQIDWLDKCVDGSWKPNPQTGLIDVVGNFSCERNQLTTLVGAPQSVGGYFYCYGNSVSETTLDSIFELMKKGKAYQKALEEHWLEMGDEDRVLMYKEMPNLSPEDIRKYKALATYNNIKGYL